MNSNVIDIFRNWSAVLKCNVQVTVGFKWEARKRNIIQNLFQVKITIAFKLCIIEYFCELEQWILFEYWILHYVCIEFSLLLVRNDYMYSIYRVILNVKTLRMRRKSIN